MKSKLNLILSLIIGMAMSQKTTAKSDLDNFDELLGTGDASFVEKRFLELLPEAEVLPDKSTYLQIISQLALTQAMQKKFDEAHKTLDIAEARLTLNYDLAKARILLERGRILHQASMFGTQDKIQRAEYLAKGISFFKQSYDLSAENKLDYHTANAAHMLGIASETVVEKIKWNELAIEHAGSSNDSRARQWISALYNNLGQNYLEAGEYDKALPIFQEALKIREKEGVSLNIRAAQWAIGHTLRLLGSLDDSLVILNLLAGEYEKIANSKTLDAPEEVFATLRGFVFEDLAEIHLAQAKQAAEKAHSNLSKASWIHLDEYKPRLERLNLIRNEFRNKDNLHNRGDLTYDHFKPK